jgi:hypothetical protein
VRISLYFCIIYFKMSSSNFTNFQR